jgi:hypothetical protein
MGIIAFVMVRGTGVERCRVTQSEHADARPNAADFPEIRELWNVLRSISASQGIDAGNLALSWAKAKRNSLSKWASENSFDELCNAGCSPVSLAISLWAVQACRRWQKTWRVTIGSIRRRDQIVRSLENAAEDLEELQNSFYGAVLEDLRKSSNDIETGDLEIHSLNVERTWPSYAPAPAPLRQSGPCVSTRAYSDFSTSSRKKHKHILLRPSPSI